MLRRLLAVLLILPLAWPASAEIATPRMLKRLKEADADKDRAVTRAEFAAYRRTQFSKMDRDGDGYVSQRDIDRIKMFMPRELEPAKLIAQFDTDHDRMISREELATGPSPVFDLADTDRDDTVSADEFVAAAAKLDADEKR